MSLGAAAQQTRPRRRQYRTRRDADPPPISQETHCHPPIHRTRHLPHRTALKQRHCKAIKPDGTILWTSAPADDRPPRRPRCQKTPRAMEHQPPAAAINPALGGASRRVALVSVTISVAMYGVGARVRVAPGQTTVTAARRRARDADSGHLMARCVGAVSRCSSMVECINGGRCYYLFVCLLRVDEQQGKPQ